MKLNANSTIEMTEGDYAELSESNVGICLICGSQKECCEPDARHYPCDECDQLQVYGLEELLMMGKIIFTE
jgi:hypothetical protein